MEREQRKKEERRNKIKERYNNIYKNIIVKAVSSYLLEIQKKKEKSW